MISLLKRVCNFCVCPRIIFQELPTVPRINCRVEEVGGGRLDCVITRMTTYGAKLTPDREKLIDYLSAR